MYKSREIRWFKPEPDKKILEWFDRKDMNLDNSENRTDHYLILTGKEDLNIKLRQGNIEVKQRMTKPEKGELIAGAVGWFETWEKWSFGIIPDDPYTDEILNNSRNQWLAIHKNRMALKLALKDSRLVMLPASEQVVSGCQIEYTRINTRGLIHYSFNLEWFGEKHIEPAAELLMDILGDSRMRLSDSMSYAGLLNRYFNP